MQEKSKADRRYDLIVWDWDGTLMDSTPTIVDCIQKACADIGLPVPPDELASHVIGLGLAEALRIAVPTIKPEQHPDNEKGCCDGEESPAHLLQLFFHGIAPSPFSMGTIFLTKP